MPTIDPLPGILGAFSETKIKRTPVNEALDSHLANLGSTFGQNVGANRGDFSKYYSALGSASPQFAQTNQANIDYISNMLKNTPDASANFKDLQNFQLGNFRSVFNDIRGAGDLARKNNLAALGLAPGSGGGSYADRATTNQLSSNSIPLLNTIFGGSANAAQSVSDQNYRNTLLNLGLLDQRLGMVDNPANRLLAPISARNNMLNSDAATAANIANATRSNILGLTEEKDLLGKIAAVGNSMTNDNANELMGMVGSAYGGGGGGGMQQPSQFSGSGFVPYGGGFGGVGGDWGRAFRPQQAASGSQYWGGFGTPDYSTGETLPSLAGFFTP